VNFGAGFSAIKNTLPTQNGKHCAAPRKCGACYHYQECPSLQAAIASKSTLVGSTLSAHADAILSGYQRPLAPSANDREFSPLTSLQQPLEREMQPPKFSTRGI
jgi:hypothetical protein